MRRLYLALACFIFIISACSKTISNKQSVSRSNGSPSIIVTSPITIKTLKPNEVLEVKAIFSDPDLVNVASWEAIKASGACGGSPHSGQFEPEVAEFEM